MLLHQTIRKTNHRIAPPPGIAYHRASDRARTIASDAKDGICATLKALMNMCLSMASSCPKHFIGFLEMKSIANSKDRLLKNGCKSTSPSLGKTSDKFATGAWKTFRSLNGFVANNDCSACRDRFQCGSSRVKTSSGSSGISVTRIYFCA